MVTQKIAAHITFFYIDKRLKYLREVVLNLLRIDADLQIFIDTNRRLSEFRGIDRVRVLEYAYSSTGRKYSYDSIFNKLGIKSMAHPYYLSWENRKIIEKNIHKYDIQIYLEDDIKFTADNLAYWLGHHEAVSRNGYHLGFLRVEFNGDEKFLTDLNGPLSKIVTIGSQSYILNDQNPYCGFWIYSQEELEAFVESSEWRFESKYYGIRERSAIGWHGQGMERYKGSIIPLLNDGQRYFTIEDCVVHHLPNNYINHSVFCSFKFPLEFPLS